MSQAAPPARPVLLAFDTSTEVLAVAVMGPLGCASFNAPGGAAASAALVPQIELALGRAGLAYADLTAIAFGRGPGAFTGLRTSCAVAQGLGLGLARPLLPLDSLLIVAEDAAPTATDTPATLERCRVAVAMDARMDEIYGAIYERGRAVAGGECADGGESDGRAWRVTLAPALYTLAAWNAELERQDSAISLLAGSALAAFGTRLFCPSHADMVPVETDRAGALMRLAQQAWSAGAAVDAAAALPIYLRDKVALTTAERDAQRLARATTGAASTA